MHMDVDKHHHDTDHSAAERTAHQHLHGKPKPSKAFKRFEKKVMAVLKEDTPTGKYTHTSTIFAPVLEQNLCTIIDKDMGAMDGLGGGGTTTENLLEFFSPRQFKDAEGILFNAKTPTYNSWLTTATNVPLISGTNFPTPNVTKVNGSSATFHFKNHSQRQITVEMYVCFGKGAGVYPRIDLQTAFATQGNISIVPSATASTEYFRNYSTSINNVPGFLEKWDVKKISWEFEPGEEAWHIMKGPSGYKMDGSKKNATGNLTAPTWLLPADQGCGCYVFFRLGTDVSLVSSSTGSYAHLQYNEGTWIKSNRLAVCRQPNFFAVSNTGTSAPGGMAIVIQRHYNIEMPEGTLGSTPINAIVMYNGYGVASGSTSETQIEEDQPSTVPTNPPK